MEKKVTVKGRAKINLSLDVVGKRENGYHDVEMVMQQVDLYDEITVAKREDKRIVIRSNDAFVPTDQKNIAYKAADKMMHRFSLTHGFDIYIDKNIPICAGLAGGSTDAAATLKAIDLICGLNVPIEALMAIGFELGADVPFCLLEGAALATGLGEVLRPIRGLEHTWLLLIKPNFGVSTKEIYQALKWQEIREKPQTEAMLNALEHQDKRAVYDNLCNVLEEVTIEKYPEVQKIKLLLKNHGAQGVLMSGSGPTVFGLYKNYDRAKAAHRKMKMLYSNSYLVKTHTINQG